MTWANGFAAEGESSPEQPENFKRLVLWSLGKSLLIPLLILAFFLAAPAWLNYKVHQEIEKSIQSSNKLTPVEKAEQIQKLRPIHFQDICDNCPPELQRLRDWLDDADITPTFQRLRWGQYLSYTLVGTLAISVSALFALNARAHRSQEDLIQCYQLGSRLSIVVAMIKVLLLIPLLGYGFFEFTVLLTDHYFPKLLLFIVGGGLYALWKSFSILLAEVPLEFQEPMARALSEAEAPELWRVVRNAAQRLQTEPPDHILVGMQTNFYVTELAVKHDSGRAEGRTLYLSYPVLKLLSPDEITAIIGHELGHFMGRDTRMTREFYPLKHKIHGTMFTLAQSGWAARPSFELLNFFVGSFEETVQNASRQRELLADQVGATLTSPQTQARALVRYHIVLEAFERGVMENLRQQAPNPLDIPVQSVIQNQLLHETKFWSQLFEQKLPHPLDSHPSLQVRLDGLGQHIDIAAAQKLAMEEPDSAYAHWLPNQEHLFAEATQQAKEALGKVHVQNKVIKADLTTDEGREMLTHHFPTVSWTIRPFAFWMPIAVCSLVFFIMVTLAIYICDITSIVYVCVAIFCLLYSLANWKQHRNGKLTLNAAGLAYTGWTRPLRFEDVASLSVHSNNGYLSMAFTFKEKQSSPWRFTLPFRVTRITFPLEKLKAESEITSKTIYRYYNRQLDETEAELVV